jgi:hypothetical protein
MAAVSRGGGGGRTSDLLALNWEHIDTAEWKYLYMPRPKTARRRGQKWVKIEMKPLVRHFLQKWGEYKTKPSGEAPSGDTPVFGTHRGRKDERQGQGRARRVPRRLVRQDLAPRAEARRRHARGVV